VHLLLEGGANCEETNRSGEAPLFQAVSRGDTAIVSLLLGKGACPDTVNPAGESALQRAVYRSNVSIVSLLLGKGADPNFKVGSGETPLYMGNFLSSDGGIEANNRSCTSEKHFNCLDSPGS
jgi:ankyrin repeat protein